MYKWSDEHKMIRDAVRDFVDKEIRPHREALEHGDMPPYDLLRKLYRTFGLDQMAAASFDRRIQAEESGTAAAPAHRADDDDGEESAGGGGGAGMAMLP